MAEGWGFYNMHTLDKRATHFPSGTEQEGVGFYHVIQNSPQFKTSELFISGIFSDTVNHG